MEKEEAREISLAYSDVAKFYPALAMPPHVAAITTFASIIAVNYGARIMAFKMRRSMEKRRMPVQAAPQPAPVTMPHNPAQPPNPETGEIDRKPVLTKDIRTGEIPGVGTIEFPSDHPLLKGGNPFMKH